MAILRMLLVEDDPADIADFTRLLKNEGPFALTGVEYEDMEVQSARNQTEADRALAEAQYDIVLLDLQYPLADEAITFEGPLKFQGMKWLPELRRRQPRAAIVILTKHTDIGNAVTAIRDYHANDFVSKTESFDHIQARIQTACKNARDLQRAIALRDAYRGLLRTLGSRALCEDIGDLISKAKGRLSRLAQEIQSGERSAIAEAPRRIREEVDRLWGEFEKLAEVLGEGQEELVEVDLVRDLIEPLTTLYEGPIDILPARNQSVALKTFPGDLKVALHEVVQNALDTRASEIKVSVESVGRDAVIHVTDNGGGFSDEALRRLDEPRPITRKDDQGRTRGLGLYIARRMMHAIGGEIRAENVAPGRARVSLTVRNLGAS